MQAQEANPLILIFGMPRSGTTWLGKIFDSHPGTVYRHEPDTFPRLETLPRFPNPDKYKRYESFVRDFVAALPEVTDAGVVAKTPLFPKSYRSVLKNRLFIASALGAKAADKFNRGVPVAAAGGPGLSSAPLVWKSIESVARLGLLMRCLPNARGIHLVRHPCGQISSVLRGERVGVFRDNSPTSEFYELLKDLLQTPQAKQHGLTLDKLRRLTAEERLAWQWVLVNEKTAADVQHLDRVRVVRYEDLCADAASVTRSLFDFTNLGWNQQTARFLHQSTKSGNDAYYSVFKNPAVSAAAWQKELAPDAIDRILGILDQSFLRDLYLDGCPRSDNRIAGVGG